MLNITVIIKDVDYPIQADSRVSVAWAIARALAGKQQTHGMDDGSKITVKGDVFVLTPGRGQSSVTNLQATMLDGGETVVVNGTVTNG